MHYRKLIILFISVLPLSVFAQDITGLWKGTLYNDTTQQYYKYEIGISQEKGKYSGFSHTWFILDDKQYFGVKKVKVRIVDDGKIIVEDDGLIANNYPVAPNKNVRQLNVLTLDAGGEVMSLNGPFSTNRTKEYHSLTGSVSLQRKNDFWQSALVPHLQELGKANDLSFVREENENLARLAIQQKTAAQQAIDKDALLANQNAMKEQQRQQALLQEQAAQKKQADLQAKVVAAQTAEREKEMKRIMKLEADIKEREEKEKLKAETAAREALQREEIAKEKAVQALAKKEAAAKTLAEKEQARQEFAKQQQVRAQEIAEENAAKLLVKQEAEARVKQEKQELQLAKQRQAANDKAARDAALAQQKVTTSQAENSATGKAVSEADNKLPASNVANRKTVLQQTVTFSSDSLQLSLYDNGEVDGDTVSVLMNGQLILAKQGLSTTAIKKTIYIPTGTDEVELLMYAESLGSIPPNTGLLVVRDGKSLYEVRFSGDLQKNASIVFKRRQE